MRTLLIFIIGLFSGFLGSTVGGGGFLSIPVFILLGFSPQASIALNKVGDIGTFVAAVANYWKSKNIHWNVAIIIAIIYITGSFIGSNIMINLSNDFLETLVAISIILALPFLFTKSLGIVKVDVSKKRKIAGFIILFFLSILGAVVGAGGAVLSTMVMMVFLGYEIVDGHATTTPSKFFSALIPSIIYYQQGFIEIIPGILVFLGMMIGGFLGSKFAIINGNRRVRLLFATVVVALTLKLLFF